MQPLFFFVALCSTFYYNDMTANDIEKVDSSSDIVFDSVHNAANLPVLLIRTYKPRSMFEWFDNGRWFNMHVSAI